MLKNYHKVDNQTHEPQVFHGIYSVRVKPRVTSSDTKSLLCVLESPCTFTSGLLDKSISYLIQALKKLIKKKTTKNKNQKIMIQGFQNLVSQVKPHFPGRQSTLFCPLLVAH